MHSRSVHVGGDEALPFVDFLFRVFCTESIHLEINPAGLNTKNISCPTRTQRFGPNQAGSHLASVLWTGLKGDGTRQVKRNLRKHEAEDQWNTEDQQNSTKVL